MRLSAVIGVYEMDEVVLDLGSEFNYDKANMGDHGEAEACILPYSTETSKLAKSYSPRMPIQCSSGP